MSQKHKAVSSNPIKLRRVRASFLNLDFPKQPPKRPGEPEKNPRWGGSFLLDPTVAFHQEDVKTLIEEGLRVSQEAFKTNAYVLRARRNRFFGVDKLPEGAEDEILTDAFYDGGTKKYEGYAGMYVAAAHSTVNGWLEAREKGASKEALTRLENNYKPLIGNRRGQVVLPGDPQFPYSGCYVNAKVQWFSNHYPGAKPRLILSLQSVQFIEDGPAFGRPQLDADKEFERLEDDPNAGAAFDGAASNWD